MASTPRLVAAILLPAALAGCAHARQRAIEEPPASATSAAEPPSTPAAAEPPSSPPSAEPPSSPLHADAKPPKDAGRPAPNVTVKHWPSSPVGGAFAGAGLVLTLFGRFCIAGNALTLILCAYAVVEGWPYLVAATVMGAGIGAAVSSSSSSSGQVQPGLPHDETAGAPRLEEPAVAAGAAGET